MLRAEESAERGHACSMARQLYDREVDTPLHNLLRNCAQHRPAQCGAPRQPQQVGTGWLGALINCSVTGSLIINNKHNYNIPSYYRPKEMLNLQFQN